MTHWLPLVPVIVAAGDTPEPGNPFGAMFMLFAPILVLYFFIVLKPQRKEQKARQSMLSALKKNDRVLTIGGIFGTVSNISADGEEVTLRVDDSAKIRFTRSSIQKILNVGDKEPDVGGSDKT
jgi:preprotein translocase subunit YajC